MPTSDDAQRANERETAQSIGRLLAASEHAVKDNIAIWHEMKNIQQSVSMLVASFSRVPELIKEHEARLKDVEHDIIKKKWMTVGFASAAGIFGATGGATFWAWIQGLFRVHP